MKINIQSYWVYAKQNSKMPSKEMKYEKYKILWNYIGLNGLKYAVSICFMGVTFLSFMTYIHLPLHGKCCCKLSKRSQ